MSAAPPLWFVYRCHYAGPLGRRVTPLPDASILAWFQRGWQEAVDPEAWVARECGGRVYGLATIFAAAQELGLERPGSDAELRALLDEHLYVEGGADGISFDGATLRVITNDDEVELAYYFFDAAYAAAHPDRVAWLLHVDPALPLGGVETGYVPPADVGLQVARPASRGREGAFVCAIFLTFHDSSSFDHPRPVLFPGLRLAELLWWLRHSEPAVRRRRHGFASWPGELLLLRAMIDPDDVDLAPALARCSRYPVSALCSRVSEGEGTGPHAAARAALEALGATLSANNGDPDRTIIGGDRNVVWMWMHATRAFGYQQWIVFDDMWAAAHRELADSLLRYADRWDPLAEAPPAAPAVVPKLDAGEEAQLLDARITRATDRALAPDERASVARDPDPRVRAAFARATSATELLAVLAGDADASVRLAVAGSLDTDEATQRRLVDDPDAEVRLALVPWALSTALVDRLADDPDPRVRQAAAAHPYASPEAQQRLARDPEPGVRAASPATHPTQLAMLAASEPRAVAGNPSASAETLAGLVDVADEQARMLLAGNWSTPAATLAQLADDPSLGVRHNVAGNEHTPPEVLWALLTGPDADGLVISIAGNRAATPGLLERIATDPRPGFRGAVARNPALPLATLQRLVADPEPSVARRAAKALARRADAQD